MKLISTLFFVFVILVSASGQEQISNVEKYTSSQDYSSSLSYDGISYYFLTNDFETNIYTIDENSIRHHATMETTLFGGKIWGEPKIDKFVFSTFSDGIIVYDFVDGSFIDTVDLTESDYQISSFVNVINDQYIIHEVSDSNCELFLQVYDLETFNVSYTSLLSDEYYITHSAIYFVNGRNVLIYDPVKAEVIGERVSNQDFQVYRDLEYIITVGVDGEVTYYKYDEIVSLTCVQEGEQVLYVQVVDNFLLMGVLDSEDVKKTKFYKKSICEEMLELDGHFTKRQVLSDFETKILFVTARGGYASGTSSKLIDLSTFDTYPFNIKDFDFCESDIAVYDSVIYVTAHKLAFEGGVSTDFFKYDLRIKSQESIFSQFSFTLGDVLVDIHLIPNSTILNLYTRSKCSEKKISQYNIVTNQFNQLEDIYQRNVGLAKTITNYTSSIDPLKFLFSSNGCIYFQDDIKTKVVSADVAISKSIYTDEKFHSLALSRDTLSIYITDLQGNTSRKILDHAFLGSLGLTVKTDHAVVLSNGNYYHVPSQKYKSIPLDDEYPSVRFLSVNKEFVVFSNFDNLGRTLYIFDTKNEVLRIVDANYIYTAFPIDRNSFLATQTVFQGSKERSLSILNNQGVISEVIYLATGEPLYYRMDPLANDSLFALPVPFVDETLFYLRKDGEYITKKVINEGTLYYRDFPLFLDGEDILALVRKEGKLAYTVLSFVNEPVYFGEVPEDVNVKEMFATKDFIYSLIETKNSSDRNLKKQLKILKYDRQDFSLIEELDLKETISPSAAFRSVLNRVDANTVLFNIYDDSVGEELYQFDLEKFEIKLTSDIYPGARGGDPTLLKVDEEWIYFNAHSGDYSRQLYRSRLSDILEINEDPEESDHFLSIYPNPSSSRISFSLPIERYFIFDTQGKLLKSDSVDVSRDINITELPVGIYVILLELNDGRKIQKKLMKVI